MLFTLIKKDVIEYLLSLRFAIACILCLVVMLVMFIVRTVDYSQKIDDYNQSASMNRQSLQTIDKPFYLSFSRLRLPVNPSPLGLFVNGINSWTGSYQLYDAEPPRPVAENLENLSGPLFPGIDLVAFVGIIMALLAIVFGYDAISGEKEKGTLRLMLSNSVPRDKIIIAKWISGYTMLVFPFVLSLAGMLAIIAMQPDIVFSDLQWIKLGVVLGCALLYIAVIFTLALCVSTLTSKASTSIVVLMTFWVILVLAIPNMSLEIGRAVKPVSSMEAMEKDRQEALDAIWFREVVKPAGIWDTANGAVGNWYAKTNWATWDQWKISRERQRFLDTCEVRANDLMNAANNRIEESYIRDLETQTRAGAWFGRISPFFCFAWTASQLADQTIAEKKWFRAQVERYRQTFEQYRLAQCWQYLEYRRTHNGERMKWPPVSDPVPLFNYQASPSSIYFPMVATDCATLCIMLVLLFLISYFAFLRYDVR